MKIYKLSIQFKYLEKEHYNKLKESKEKLK